MLKLTSQQFAVVYESLRAAGKSGGSEKRQSTRMDVQASIQLATLSDRRLSKSYRGLTRDISASGVGFLQHAAAEMNSKMVVRFPAGKTDMFVVCIVRFCRVLGDGLFDIGTEFDGLADEKIVEQFLNADSANLDRIRNSILN